MRLTGVVGKEVPACDVTLEDNCVTFLHDNWLAGSSRAEKYYKLRSPVLHRSPAETFVVFNANS
jgi:hypothetical protein